MKAKEFVSSWKEKSTIPLALLGLLYLVAYSVQVLNDENAQLVAHMEIVSLVIWGIYLTDLVLRLVVAENFGKFVRSSWLEILALALPFIRFLRVFRVVLALKAIRGLVSNRASAAGTYLLMLVPLTWFSGAVAVLDAEAGNPEASITDLREALWWSLATITTVGYGDKYPTTLDGQLVAGVLMLTGIALFSAGAGIFASWILGEKRS